MGHLRLNTKGITDNIFDLTFDEVEENVMYIDLDMSSTQINKDQAKLIIEHLKEQFEL